MILVHFKILFNHYRFIDCIYLNKSLNLIKVKWLHYHISSRRKEREKRRKTMIKFIHSRENREQSLNFERFPCSISTTEPVLRVKNSQ